MFISFTHYTYSENVLSDSDTIGDRIVENCWVCELSLMGLGVWVEVTVNCGWRLVWWSCEECVDGLCWGVWNVCRCYPHVWCLRFCRVSAVMFIPVSVRQLRALLIRESVSTWAPLVLFFLSSVFSSRVSLSLAALPVMLTSRKFHACLAVHTCCSIYSWSLHAPSLCFSYYWRKLKSLSLQ